MSEHKILMLGASAGGIEIVCKFLAALPKNLNVAIVIVIHIPGGSISALEKVLARCCAYPVTIAANAIAHKPNHVYLSPGDHHLLLNDTNLYLSTGPKINRFRPSIDVAFNSAALNCDGKVIGILFSGLLSDGVQGLNAIQKNGGVTIVQDPNEAPYPDLPINAIRAGAADHVLTLKKMSSILPKLIKATSKPRKKRQAVSAEKACKAELAGSIGQQTYPSYLDNIGNVSFYTCPDCCGTLWEIEAEGVHSFRCRTGHQYDLESLQQAQTDTLENILWSAVRALEECHDLSKRIAQEFQNKNMTRAANLYSQKAGNAHKDAAKIRELLLSENVLLKNTLP